MKLVKWMKKGQMLIEAVMAFGIAMVALVALLRLSSRSVGNSGLASRQAVATNYATEAMQWLKNERANEDGFKTIYDMCGGTPSCNAVYNIGGLNWDNAGSTIANTDGEYTRELELNGDNSSGKMQITAMVTVTWFEDGRETTAEQTFIFVAR